MAVFHNKKKNKTETSGQTTMPSKRSIQTLSSSFLKEISDNIKNESSADDKKCHIQALDCVVEAIKVSKHPKGGVLDAMNLLRGSMLPALKDSSETVNKMSLFFLIIASLIRSDVNKTQMRMRDRSFIIS